MPLFSPGTLFESAQCLNERAQFVSSRVQVYFTDFAHRQYLCLASQPNFVLSGDEIQVNVYVQYHGTQTLLQCEIIRGSREQAFEVGER